MPKFSDLLAALTGSPKTLTSAASAISDAKAQLDSVAALFTAAGLNVETMLAAGPDSLKAHLASLTANDAALATAQAKITELTGALSAKDTAHASAIAASEEKLKAAAGWLAGAHDIISAIGLDPQQTLTAGAAKAAFEAHSAKAANVILAKSGHPPIRELPGAAAVGAKVMTRKAFNAIGAKEQSAFSLSGGHLTD